MPTRVIVDFDSTVVQVEALDELAKIALEKAPDRQERLEKIRELTNLAMSGKIGFKDALAQRLALFAANRQQIDELIALLKSKVTPSFREYAATLQDETAGVYIVSGGFKDYIVPVVAEFGIEADRVLANDFVWDGDTITGCDTTNPLSGNSGKVKVLRDLSLMGRIVIVGDGFSDLEVAKAGAAHQFVAMTENVARPEVIREVEHVAHDFGEVVKMIRQAGISYPKHKLKALLLENIHAEGVAALEAEGYQVETRNGAMSETELAEAIKDVSILGIRSNTQVTAEVLENAKRLLVIGAFCIGTNQIDLAAASRKGVAVFNAPFSNTRSVVELAIADIIALSRRLTERNAAMHDGRWEKSATGSHEVRGRTLGIIGYGHIGSQLSVLAEALGMRVVFFDIADRLAFGNAQSLPTLEAVLAEADIVSVHVDGRSKNRGLFGAAEFAAMKPGTLFLNLSRGMVVDEEALAKALTSGHLAGAAVDVFAKEPKTSGPGFESALRGLENVILTPHVASGTEEAQESIGQFVATKLIQFINEGSTALSVNLPALELPPQEGSHRLVLIHRNVPGVLARINSLFGEHEVNIDAQYLATRGEIGYVITDINSVHGDDLTQPLKDLPETIRLRILY